MKHTKIAIIGIGHVGSTIAYALILQKITPEIILIDIDEMRCKGEILDLSDALSFDGTSSIKAGTTQDASQADIIIIAAGKPQTNNMTRLELFETNKKIISQIIEQIQPINPNAIIIMVTNPVDLMTYHVQKIANLPHHQVFGSGTLLDTQRLHFIIGAMFNISQESINAFIIGEHGDSQTVVWSCAQIGGIPIHDFPEITQNKLNDIAQIVKNKAYEIISCKGSTCYGIATGVAKICKAIIFDQKLVLPLSVYNNEFDMYLSMPATIGENGIEKILTISLNKEEQEQLQLSAQQLRSYVKK